MLGLYQIKAANEKRKARLQKRLDTIKEECNARTAKLRQASALINEALSSKPVAREAEAVSVF